MCGISGYINFDKLKYANLSVVKKMTDKIAHRGPDGEGFYVSNNVALGHRRLSIIDLETGTQPMYSDDKNKVLVFNGEIYNYIELREELKLLGYQFNTSSDTEVILKAYEEWGYQCQNKFNGMWAFALWDNQKDELFISRDRFGEKPLFYTTYNNAFIFASEIKALAEYGIPLVPKYELLEIYLFLTYIPAPDSFYKNIYKLMPGHFLVIKNKEVKESSYWKFPQIEEKEMYKDKKFVYEKFEKLFHDSVSIRTRSDVPYGAFLSGGLDSSSVVSKMSDLSEKKVKTFTIGFKDKAFDESLLANEVAKSFNTNHYTETVEAENFGELLQKIANIYDEPFGDSSSIPTEKISGFAKKHVKMVLTGDGGDELLSGYIAYTGIKLAQKINKIPAGLRKILIRLIAFIKKLFKGRIRYKFEKLERIIYSAEYDFINRLIIKSTPVSPSLIKKLTSNVRGIISIEEYLNKVMSGCTYKDDFYKMMYFHYHVSLPNDYLVKVDRASMANSLETRLPFLDYRLVEFMAKVHKNVKMQGWERKSVLRKTIGKNLPKSILKAPKKGFGIPIREWFKEKSIFTFVTSNIHEIENILEKSVLEKIFEENKEGAKDYGNFIWTLLILEKKLQATESKNV